MTNVAGLNQTIPISDVKRWAITAMVPIALPSDTEAVEAGPDRTGRSQRHKSWL
jgi:hypothetical protein